MIQSLGGLVIQVNPNPTPASRPTRLYLIRYRARQHSCSRICRLEAGTAPPNSSLSHGHLPVSPSVQCCVLSAQNETRKLGDPTYNHKPGTKVQNAELVKNLGSGCPRHFSSLSTHETRSGSKLHLPDRRDHEHHPQADITFMIAIPAFFPPANSTCPR